MKSYTYRISDSYIIIITSDPNFRDTFLNHFAHRYGPRNRRGFAKVFGVQDFKHALSLFDLQHTRYIVVIDNNIESGDSHSFFAQVQDKLTQQLMLFHNDPKELKIHERMVESEIYLVLLTEENEPLSVGHFSEHTTYWQLSKPVTLENIDLIINPYVFRDAQWLRNPVTYLPSWRLIDKKTEEVANSTFQTSFFVKVLGFGNEQKTKEDRDKQLGIMHFIAEIIEQSVEEQGDSQNWIGHAGGFEFFVVVGNKHLDSIIQRIQFLFKSGIQEFHLPENMQLSLVFHSQHK